MLYFMIVAVLVFFSGLATAQKGPCTEQLIRETNANHVGSALADDVYVVSPAHNGPVIGKTEVEESAR